MFHARWRELIPPAGLIWMEFIDSASLKVELHLCLYCVQKSRSEIGAALTDTRRLKAICQPVSWSQIRVRNQQLPKRINSKSGKFPLPQSWWFACLACLLDNKRWIRWRRRPATPANLFTANHAITCASNIGIWGAVAWQQRGAPSVLLLLFTLVWTLRLQRVAPCLPACQVDPVGSVTRVEETGSWHACSRGVAYHWFCKRKTIKHNVL